MNNLILKFSLPVLLVVLVVSLGWSSWDLYRQKVNEVNTLTSELTQAEKLPSVQQLMMLSDFKNIDIPLGDFGLASPLLTQKTFQNCRIHGSVVVYIGDNVTIVGNHFEGDFNSMFIVTTNTMIDGVLEITDCSFINCYFDHVSFIGDADTIASFKNGFSGG